MPGEREIAQALLTNYEPSLRDRAGNAIYDIAQALGMGSTANRMRNEGTAVMDFIPGVGEVLGVNDAMNDFSAGNYGMAATGLGLTAVGAVPGVGGAVKAAKPKPQWMIDILSKASDRKALASDLAASGGSTRLTGPNGMTAIAGPDMSRPGGYRLTIFDGSGPLSHTEYDSLEASIDEALKQKYNPMRGK